MRDLPAPSGGTASPAVVAHDPELQRVLALPRRREITPEEIELISAAVRKREFSLNGERNVLLPAQAEGMCEVFDVRGLAGHLGVGTGKTLLSMILPVMLNSEHPVLVIPASLREKTQRDFARYVQDWHCRLPTIVTYEELGRPDRDPGDTRYLCARRGVPIPADYVFFDECDMMRADSARSRKIDRFIQAAQERGDCVIVNASGTFLTEKLMDSWRLTRQALGPASPLPTREAAAERWAAALDADLGPRPRLGLGALADIPGGHASWFRESRGVLCRSSSDCDAPINISIWDPGLSPILQETIDAVQRSSMRPDGEMLGERELPVCVALLAQGLYNVWDPMPPLEWLQPRRAWNAYVAAVKEERLDGYDSEGQLTAALRKGTAIRDVSPNEGRSLLAAWEAVKPTFTPNPVPVWVDPSPVIAAVDRLEPGTIVWTRSRAVGALLNHLGVPWYGEASDPESETHGRPMGCSIAAHHRGANLQYGWHRMLFLQLMSKQQLWEQAIGRVHRRGQRADRIEIELYAPLEYHRRKLRQVLADAGEASERGNVAHKLVLADWAEIP